jgi:hypothetical protein
VARDYDWSGLDESLRLVRSHGLTPLVYVTAAPSWARRTIAGVERPDPVQFGAFALAAVRRYSGETRELPRVRLWQAWNEPNKIRGPEYTDGAASWYRKMVNAFAASVHSESGNLVVAGGLSPFGSPTVVAPLAFMRSVLCLAPAPRCSEAAHFDVWATDPYTAGGPTHHAYQPNDVSLGDLPEMKALLDEGVQEGRIVSNGPVRFWVTEFSWDSDPPDPAGVPVELQGRWVAEALYRMWKAGVSLVTWFTLRDRPVRTSPYQAGLYFSGASPDQDRPKPALTAFRFPFVAFARNGRVTIWGRTPRGAAEAVVIEQRKRSGVGWRAVATLDANRAGIFQAALPADGDGDLRARVPASGAKSLPFSLQRVPDRIYQPFGT